jgi:hypothetical protein
MIPFLHIIQRLVYPFFMCTRDEDGRRMKENRKRGILEQGISLEVLEN